MNRKNVLITGGATGIGKSIASLFLENGANVFIVDSNEEALLHSEQNFAKYNKQVSLDKLDVGKEENVKTYMEKMKNASVKWNVIINNAGISTFTPFEEMSLSSWNKVIETNLTSVFLITRYALSSMNKNSSVINIASTRAKMSEENSEAYAASKGGIVALTHALAASLHNYNIRVNCISPGWIETGDYSQLRRKDHDQHWSKRVGKPEDIARLCLFLADSENDFLTGENITVDGGMTRKMIYEH